MTQGQALAMAMEAQPDLDWTEHQLAAKRLYDWCADLRAATRFLENIVLPLDTYVSTCYGNELNINLTAYKPYGTYDSQKESSVDIEASRKNMAKIIKQIGPCEKKYTDTEFEVVKRFGKIRVIFAISRQTVCEQVVIGKEWVEPRKGYFRDKTDYKCEKISFKELEG